MGKEGRDAGGHSCVVRVGARARLSVLLADIHGSCSGSGRVRAPSRARAYELDCTAEEGAG